MNGQSRMRNDIALGRSESLTILYIGICFAVDFLDII